jgi:antitoxin CptB
MALPAHEAHDAGAAESLENAIADPIYLSRLRWRCRRGMLENDLVLARFLDARGDSLAPAEVAALDRALDLPDGELWDLIAQRAEPDDPALRPIVDALRAA